MKPLQLHCKYQRSTAEFSVDADVTTVADLKTTIAAQFALQSNTLKLVGTKVKWATADDETLLSELQSLQGDIAAAIVVKLMVLGVPANGVFLQQLQRNDSIAAIQQNRDDEQQKQQLSLFEQQRAAEHQQMLVHQRRQREREQQQQEREHQQEQQRQIEEQQRLIRQRVEEQSWQQLQQAIPIEMKSAVTVRYILTAAAMTSGNNNNNSSSTSSAVDDRMILSASCLEHLVDSKVSFPLCFAVIRSDSNSNSNNNSSDDDSIAAEATTASPVGFLSVADFSAPAGTALLSTAFMQQHDIIAGDLIRIQTVTPPTATAIGLQVTGAAAHAWLLLSPLEQKALLHQELRRHQHLQRQQLLTINYTLHHPQYTLCVTDTQPGAVVSIIDADVATDVVPMIDDNSSSSNKLATIDLQMDDSSADNNEYIVAADAFVNFKLTVTDCSLDTIIDVTCIDSDSSSNSDADVFVTSPAETAWLATDAATHVAHSYSNQTAIAACANRHKIIRLSRNVNSSNNSSSDGYDCLYQTGVYQIAVAGHSGKTRFRIKVTSAPAAARVAVAAVTAAASSSSSTSAAATVECNNCHRHMAAGAYRMHELQCSRLNHYCGSCATVLPIKDREKHQHVLHSKQLHCLCGFTTGGDGNNNNSTFMQHRRNDCSLRLVRCLYCPLSQLMRVRGQHQGECGSIESHCRYCASSSSGADVTLQRKFMKRHIEQHHVDETTMLGLEVTCHMWW